MLCMIKFNCSMLKWILPVCSMLAIQVDSFAAQSDLSLRRTRTLHLESGQRTRVDYQQFYRGIPVFGGGRTVLLDQKGKVLAKPTDLSRTNNSDIYPSLLPDKAKKIAGVRDGKASASLVIYNPSLIGAPGNNQGRLAWKVITRSSEQKQIVIVDANSGMVLLKMPLVETALQRRICDAGNYRQGKYFPCLPKDAARKEGGSASAVKDVNDAYQSLGAIYHFYQNNFGRDGIDGQGMPMVATVRYCPGPGVDPQCPWFNAYWDSESNQMVFGNGMASADDIAMHEVSHGITSRTSNLFYAFQSGAINESFSDIMGEIFDQLWHGSGKDGSQYNWVIGEDTRAGMLRSMKDPAVLGDPDYTGSSNWSSAELGPEVDNGGVHHNSGVMNKAAYLMAQGGSFRGWTISPIGLLKTAKLFYWTNTQLLRSGSDYRDLSAALRTICSASPSEFSEDDCQQVNKAILATQMDFPPRIERTPSPVACSDSQGTDVWSSEFELGQMNKWEASPGNTQAVIWSQQSTVQGDYSFAKDGQDLYASLDPNKVVSGQSEDSSYQTKQGVSIPSRAYLMLNHSFYIGSTIDDPTSGLLLEWSEDQGSSWHDLQQQSSGDHLGGYGAGGFHGWSSGVISSRWSLTELSGKTVLLRLRFKTRDRSLWISAAPLGGWWIDKLRIHQCDIGKEPTDKAAWDSADHIAPRTWAKPVRTKVNSHSLKEWHINLFSNEQGASFECKLMDTTLSFQALFKPWVPCGQRWSQKPPRQSMYYFYYRSVDSSGNPDLKPHMVMLFSDWTSPRANIISWKQRGGKLAIRIHSSETLDYLRLRLDGKLRKVKLDADNQTPNNIRFIIPVHSKWKHLAIRVQDAVGNWQKDPIRLKR